MDLCLYFRTYTKRNTHTRDTHMRNIHTWNDRAQRNVLERMSIDTNDRRKKESPWIHCCAPTQQQQRQRAKRKKIRSKRANEKELREKQRRRRRRSLYTYTLHTRCMLGTAAAKTIYTWKRMKEWRQRRQHQSDKGRLPSLWSNNNTTWNESSSRCQQRTKGKKDKLKFCGSKWIWMSENKTIFNSIW